VFSETETVSQNFPPLSQNTMQTRFPNTIKMLQNLALPPPRQCRIYL